MPVYEQNGHTINVGANIITDFGILTGIAVDKGLFSVSDKISVYLPQVSKYPEKEEITIENLLMMKSGIDFDNDGYNGGERDLIFTWGRGGQFVFINRDKNLIVVMTSETNTSGDFNFSISEGLSIYDRINSIAASYKKHYFCNH